MSGDNFVTQQKTLVKWVNYIMNKNAKNMQIQNTSVDFQDGLALLGLVEIVTGEILIQEKGSTRIHKIFNVNKAIEVLKSHVRISNIQPTDIVNGKSEATLELLWVIVECYRRKEYMHQEKESYENERVLLLWCRQCTQKYREVDIQNFTTSWKDGLAFNALINFHRPDLFEYQKLVGKSPKENLQHAFQRAKELGVPPLLDADDVLSEIVDKKCVFTYVTTLREVLIKQKFENEEIENQVTTRSDSPTPSSVSTMSEWDDFNETLQQVLTWLQQAEIQLKHQEYVSENVDKVKEQFREHEDFMMILTSHQTSVGSVLEFGSQLINENIVVGKEEKEIREQMTLLSERWENLRVSAMQRQADLHQHLMKLQQLQLKELGDWLTKAEIKMKTADRIGSDIDVVKRQVEEHKLMQEDLENQQQQVNSLSHMVVVVDEAESEDATADLEEQLGVLGERWSLVCKWTEQRWNSLQEVLTSWQQYRDEEQRLNEWLSEKEKALKEISDVDMGDKKEVQLQIQKLKSLEIELTRQQASFGNFNNAAQAVAQTLEEDSPTINRIQDTMEDFNNRWNKIASMLNTKMKHLRSMENRLQSFLKELDENLNWIIDAETLLKPQKNPQKELIESLHQAIMKRRTSITVLANTGKELMSQTLTAGQSGIGIQQSLINFTNHWDSLQKMVMELRQENEVSELKKKFIVEVQRILTAITEITTYVEKISVELAKDPKDLFKKIEIKIKELMKCSELLESLSKECQFVSDPALKSALNVEIEDAVQKLKKANVYLEEKKQTIMVTIQSMPPQEFLDSTSLVKEVLDEVFPFVSKEFKYAETPEMKILGANLEEKLLKLKKLESTLKSLTNNQNELLRSLHVDISQKYRKQITDLNRQWMDCVKITEARLQRVNEALLQTKELDIAMSETFNWMDDVDKFLDEIRSTIAEGDAETLSSQVQEVEALQQDISTVQKKVDSLIETCTLIMNRGEDSYSAMLQLKLKNLRERWGRVIVNTEKQKENLRNAGLKFQEVKAGIKALLEYLTAIEINLQNEKCNSFDKNGLKLKIDAYEEIKMQLVVKGVIIDEYLESVNQLIATAPSGTETPAVIKELVHGSHMFAKVTAKVDDFLLNLKSTFSKLEVLENLISMVYQNMDVTEIAIDSAKLKLNEDDEKLEKCLADLDNQYSYLSSENLKDIDNAASDITMNSNGMCSSFVCAMISDYESRLEDTRERSKKFRYIVEGELLKRRQLSDDLVQIDNWLQTTEKLVNERINGFVVIEEQFIENLQEQVSLNLALVSSAEGTIKELILAGGPQNHITLENKFNGIKSRWSKLIESIKVLEQQPNIKEMEKRFAALEGSTLSDIDNLKRRIKKVKLASPEVPDIQLAVEALEQLSSLCSSIEDNILALQNIAADISTRVNKNLDPQVDQVRKEYENVKNLLKVQEIIFGDALPLSEIIYANLDSLNDWLRSIQDSLNNISKEFLPEFPEDSIQNVQTMISELNAKAQDVQQLNNNTVQLCKMSEADSFRLLEARVHDIYDTYTSTKQQAKEKYDLLLKQHDQVKEYKEIARDLNAWIDSRRSTLEAIGGVSNKFDIEMELMKLKGIKSIVDAKESELDCFKARGDDITAIGNSKLVNLCEKDIFKRWNELEDKIRYIQATLEIKLKEIERTEGAPPAKQRVIEQEEIVISEPIRTVEVQSINIDLLNEDEELTEKKNKSEPLIVPSEPMEVQESERMVFVKQPSFDRKVNLNKTIESLVAELDEIEKSLFSLNSSENIKDVQENVEKLDNQLFGLQPDFESLLEEAGNKVGELELNNNSILKLTRKISSVHIGLEMRRQSLRESDYKLNCINTDLAIIRQWLVQTDQLLRDPQSDKLKGLELFELRAAELEAVNIRAEQLSNVCSDTQIPKEDIIGLNKKFKLLSRHFEQYQRPEEKVTTYKISVETGDFPDADTRANVSIKLFGEYGNSDQLQFQKSETKRKKFQVNQVDLFTFRNQPWLGKLSKLRVWHDNEGASPAWYLQSIYILDELSGRLFCFVIKSWLSKDKGAVLKEAPVNAVALYKESGSDVLTKKHRVVDIHWLFESVANAKKIKPYQEFVSDIKNTIVKLEELQSKLKLDCFSGKPFDEYAKQEAVINEVLATVNELHPVIASTMASCEQYLSEGTEKNMQEIDISLTLMRSKWNSLNKDLKERQLIFSNIEKQWKKLHIDITEFSSFLGGLENEISTCERTEKNYKALEAAVQEKSELFHSINQLTDHVIVNSSEINGRDFYEKQLNLKVRWEQIKKQLSNIKMSLFSGDERMKSVIKSLDVLERLLTQSKHVLFNIKPHPLNEEDLEVYLQKLQNIKSNLADQADFMTSLKLDTKTLFYSKDLSPIQLEEIIAHSKLLQQEWDEVTTFLPSRLTAIQEQLSKATLFLEQLEELYDWVCSTRNILEKFNQGKAISHVDPQITKVSIKARHSNIEAINCLIEEYKVHGDQSSSHFPQDISDKVRRLNDDWQVILTLSNNLEDQTISEEILIEELVKESESAVTMFDNDTLQEDTVNKFEKNVAELHDVLKLIEQKLKGFTLNVGDPEDIESAIQKHNAIQQEVNNRRGDLEEVIEMGAALTMDSKNETFNYATDDKITKLKERWEVVSEKIASQKKMFEQLNRDMRHCNEIITRLDNWIHKAVTQLNERLKVGSTVTELEYQLNKHKVFQEELMAFSNQFNIVRKQADDILQNYSSLDLTSFKGKYKDTIQALSDVDAKSNARQQSLQEALDNLLLFHKNMISALTWLSSAESKVAELDSLVEASQTEDNTDVEELQQEMLALEEDIALHQAMFQSLNDTGNQIMVDLEQGEVRTALQSKLDDMNDRWNSLGLRVVDIRDRMTDGSGEWRQLLFDMQEIVDWLVRAGQELASQQPIGSDISTVQHQNDNHQAFKGKLRVRQVVIKQVLDQGHNFLLKHQARELVSREDNLAASVQEQIEHIEMQWQVLMNNSEKWQTTIDAVLELVNKLLKEVDDLHNRLKDAENRKNRWNLTSDFSLEDAHKALEEVKLFNESVTSLEPYIDNVNGKVKILRLDYGVELGGQKQRQIDEFLQRWNQLQLECERRHNNLNNILNSDQDKQSQLQGSVSPPWERSCSLNKVPYYINHDTKVTQWDHPKMTELYNTLAELNDVKFAAYRTSMKLRCIQKACCLDLAEMDNVVLKAFQRHDLSAKNDSLIEVGEMIAILLTIFGNIEPTRKEAIIVPQCVDLTLNWLLNVFDSGRIGKLRVLSFKIAIVLLCRAKLENKWKYLFEQIADPSGHADSKKLGLLLHDCVQIPRQLGEIAAFGGSNIEPSARSCFEKAKNPSFIEVSNFLEWTSAEPQSLVWMTVLHRLAAAETAKHDAKCGICKDYPIVGFRYRCLKCFNYDLCQNCFWSGRVSKSHRLTHPMHQYSLATTAGEDMSDFVKLMKNKFKSRRYRSRPPKKLGYLPVQTIMEGSSIETPSVPSSPNMNFSFSSNDGSASPTSGKYRMVDDINEEHRLIQHMCRSLSSEDARLPPLKSPSAILASLDIEEKQNVDEIISSLEEEHRALESEYNRLKNMRTNGSDPQSSPRDAELIAEAQLLRQHKGRLEARMQILEDHNKQLEGQLQRLRQLLEQPQSDRSVQSSAGVTPSLTPSSSYHGSPELARRDHSFTNGYSLRNAIDIQQVTNQIEHAFPMD